MGADFGPANELYPPPDQVLSRLVRRMRLTGKDELHRTMRIRQQTKQSLRVAQSKFGRL